MTKQKILIVDDKEENLFTLAKILKATGAEIISARNGNDALTASLNHDFAVAILDVQMPEMDGYELASHLRSDSRTKNLPVIFLSAVYSDEDHVFKGYESGAVDFVTKPYNPKIFLSKVNAFLERDRLLRELQKEITERKKTEADLQKRTLQLEAANKELESFSYSISHDLRAPLRAIDGYARMILKKQADKFNEETKERFNVIRKNVEMMGKLIDDLLALSRLGRQSLSMDPLNMDDLINAVWKELQVINPGREMKLTLKSMPRGCGDKALLKQVYANLLANAVKFTKYCKAAQIEAGGCAGESEYIYYIKDNGAGFDMAYYDKLFGVFQRLHSNEEFEGTGIGLATVQRIIRRHGGRVWAEGEENKGATFYFSLPLL